MMLGAFSLVGLRISGPDIEDTMNGYMETANAAVICSSELYHQLVMRTNEIQEENAMWVDYFVDTRWFGDTPGNCDSVCLQTKIFRHVQVGEWRVSYEIGVKLAALLNDG